MKARLRAFAATPFLNDLTDAFTRLSTTPEFAVSVLIVVLFSFSHADKLETGPFGSFFSSHKDNPVVAWILNNEARFFGILSFVPSYFAITARYRSLVSLFVLIGVFMIKEHSMMYYLFVSIVMSLYFRVRVSYNKLLLIIAAVAFVYLDGFKFFTSKPAAPTVVNHAASHH